MATMWMVRAGEGGYLIDEFKSKGIVAVGWRELGDVGGIDSKEKLKVMMARTYPDWSEGEVNSSVSRLWKFLHEVEKGDEVISYNSDARIYLVGQISSDYRFEKKGIPEFPQVKGVKWSASVSRDDLSVGSKNSLGAIQTIFKIPAEVAEEIRGLIKGEKPQTEPKEEDLELNDIKRDTQERAREFIKDQMQRLTWEEMQELVAGVLRAMGYKTKVSAKGSDRGKDIIASPDGLGLEDPRIRVEVKHRVKQTMGTQEVRSFIATLRQNDKGLYVSTGGFSNEAHYEAERSNVPVTLIDMDALVQLLEQNYEKMDPESRTLVPLVRVYFPADMRTAAV